MAIYAIYSYEIREGNGNLFCKETEVKAIDMANEIIGNLLRDGLNVVGKKRKENQPLKSLNLVEHDHVFAWVLCNVKDITQYEGHERNTLESHPGSYVILDNRPDVCQIAIERNSAFDADTDKVVKYLARAFNSHLPDYGLKMVISRKWQAGEFKKVVRERILKHKDAVRKVVWEFPNPDKVRGIDATSQMKRRLESLKNIAQTMNALKGQLTLTGSKGNPLVVDDDQIEVLADIIALSAQNDYKLTYYFFKTATVNIKDVAYASASIDAKVITEFEHGQTIDSGKGATFELIEVLDEIRKTIGDYDREKIIESGE
ncbi:MAG: hypothetical protein ACI4UA_04790 [Bacteroidaceae bacterium]